LEIMTAMNPHATPRWFFLVLALIGASTLLIAAIHTPVGDWDQGTWIMAISAAVVTVLWLVYGLRGNVSLLGKLSGRNGAIISGIGAFGSGVIVGSVIFTDEWAVQDILMAGFFLALALMFAAAFWLSTQKMKARRLQG
jgi:hypothetical protein